MAFLGYSLQYMLKINLGIAIVCMVNNTALHNSEPSQNLTESFDMNSTISGGEPGVTCLFQEASGTQKMVEN